MIRKYIFGSPVETGAVVENIAVSNAHPDFGNVLSISPFSWKYNMQDNTRIFGLGEAVRGMNKRGFIYESWCSDVPRQDEGTRSMYGAHNFFIVKEGQLSICLNSSSEYTDDIAFTIFVGMEFIFPLSLFLPPAILLF